MDDSSKKNDLAFVAMLTGLFFLAIWGIKLFFQFLVWYFQMLVKYPVRTISITAGIIAFGIYQEYSERRDMRNDLLAMEAVASDLPKEQKAFNLQWLQMLEKAEDLSFNQRIEIVENETNTFFEKNHGKLLKDWRGHLTSASSEDGKIFFKIKIPGTKILLGNGNNYDSLNSVKISGSSDLGSKLIAIPENTMIKFTGTIQRQKEQYETTYKYFLKLSKIDNW